MKKIIAFFISLILISLILIGTEITFSNKIQTNYYDHIGDDNSLDKLKSLPLQSEAAKTKDNLFIFGSSEVGGLVKLPQHARNFFKNKKDGFQVYLIGRGGFQCLVHAIDFGAMGSQLKNQKVVFFLSPQWFTPSGIDQGRLMASSSEEAIYTFLLKSNVKQQLKVQLARRISEVIKDDTDFKTLKFFCDLYGTDYWWSKAAVFMVKPFYRFEDFLLFIKDQITSNNLLIDSQKKNIKSNPQPFPQNITPQHTSFDWAKERDKAVTYAKTQANNNPFYFDNIFYSGIKKDLVKKHKGSYKNRSFAVSTQYDDFKLLLDICKDQGIKPLIVNIPVNGWFYDYAQFSITDRQQYYKKINNMVKSYGFDLADFSNYEYEPYFLQDNSHLGWLGWIYVDEAIDKYYHS